MVTALNWGDFDLFPFMVATELRQFLSVSAWFCSQTTPHLYTRFFYLTSLLGSLRTGPSISYQHLYANWMVVFDSGPKTFCMAYAQVDTFVP